MNELFGINPKETLYDKIYFVGTLLFTHYPTTIVYSDEGGTPIIKEWVDCSDDNKIDRFFFYSVTKTSLKKFISGDITHLEFINSSIEDYVIFQDIEGDHIHNTVLISTRLIPSNYKPSRNFVFKPEDGVDIAEITNHFGLDLVKEDEHDSIDVLQNISSKSNSETIYFHLNKGKGIGQGRVSTEVFGKTLINFDRLYKSVALDHILGIHRGEIDMDAKKNEDYAQFTDTEIYGEKVAASYGFFIRPKITQMNAFGETDSESIVLKAFQLIKRSKETDTLKDEYLLHSEFTIRSYKQFLEIVYRLRLKIDIDWFNPVNKKYLNDKLDFIKADKILTDIDNLAVTDTSKFNATGKFRAVNCDTGHFNFVSTTEEQYSGYFDKLIREGIVMITFTTIYQVFITRNIIKEAGKPEERTIDTITGYVPEV